MLHFSLHGRNYIILVILISKASLPRQILALAKHLQRGCGYLRFENVSDESGVVPSRRSGRGTGCSGPCQRTRRLSLGSESAQLSHRLSPSVIGLENNVPRSDSSVSTATQKTAVLSGGACCNRPELSAPRQRTVPAAPSDKDIESMSGCTDRPYLSEEKSG